jgi:prevent-host-death family protein
MQEARCKEVRRGSPLNSIRGIPFPAGGLLVAVRSSLFQTGFSTQKAEKIDLVHALVHTGPDMDVNIHEAKTHLSRLLQRVAAGDDIVIARAGVPVARLVPVETHGGERKLGIDRGKIQMAEDFDGPLPNAMLAGFYGIPAKSGKRDRPERKAKPRRPSVQH